MTISYENTAEDAVAWHQFYFQTPRAHRELRRSRFAGSLSTASVFFLLSLVLAQPASPEAALPLLAISTATGIGQFLIRSVRTKKDIDYQVRKLVSDGELDMILGSREVSLLPEGFRITSSKGTTTLKWEAIQRWTSSDTHLVFFYSNVDFVLIPKRAFGSPQQAKDFLDTVEEYRDNAIGLSTTHSAQLSTPTAPQNLAFVRARVNAAPPAVAPTTTQQSVPTDNNTLSNKWWQDRNTVGDNTTTEQKQQVNGRV